MGKQKRIYVISLCKCNLSTTFIIKSLLRTFFFSGIEFHEILKSQFFLVEFTYANYVKDNFLQEYNFANPTQLHVTSFPPKFLPLKHLKITNLQLNRHKTNVNNKNQRQQAVKAKG